MKLVLFDVDGTILSASGAGRRALGHALCDVYGTAGPIDGYDFHGATDPQIVRDLLGATGLSETAIAARETELFDRYLQYLEEEIRDGRSVRLFPGVAQLIELLAGCETCVVGLLTGNIEAGAHIKLRPTGLLPWFRLGAYGSDAADRVRLPAIAARRAEVLVGCAFRGRDLVIIGDTPRDVNCARTFGAACVAVATGRHSVAELEAVFPDHVFSDFRDADRVLRAILDATRRP